MLVGLAFLATGCGTTAPSPAPGAAAFRPAPEVPPIERLGRWDRTTFEAVTPGSVRNGHLYVLVHGWAPGYLAAVQAYRGPGPLLAWSPQAVNAQDQPMYSDFNPLAAAITRADPAAIVLGFSWLDDAATARSPLVAWKSEARTDLNGQRLAAALGQVLAPTFTTGGGRIHLIGHSHGAKVATVAAIALDHPPEQLTLLDSPENDIAKLPGAANHLEGYLPLLPIGRVPGQTFVDSYFSLTGERYGGFAALENVVDVQLDPVQFKHLDVDDLIARHEYPVDWYTASVRDLAAGVGLAWSPLVGMPPTCLACFFRQAWARLGGGVDRAAELQLRPVAVTRTRHQIARHLEVAPLRGPSASRRPDGVVLGAPGTRLWQVSFDRAPDDLAIEFDDRFISPAAGAQLAVWLDDRHVFTTAPTWSGATGDHAVIDVGGLDSGPHTLTAVVTPPTKPESRAEVVLGGFTVTSQPGIAAPDDSLSIEATLALLAFALFAIIGLLLWVLRRGERRAEEGASAGG